MDFSESTKIVYNRIHKLEPENANKIIGYLLLKDHNERDMIRLAFSPDNLLHSLINKVKNELGLCEPGYPVPISPSRVTQAPLSDLPIQFSSYTPATLLAANTYWDPQVPVDQQPVHNMNFVPQGYPDHAASLEDHYHLRNQMQFLNLEDPLDSANSVSSDFSNNCYYHEPAMVMRTSRRSPSLPELPVKVCHYFNKGFCKHGNNCRYFHNAMPESFSHIFTPNSNEFTNDDHNLSPGSLEKLERELTELLKSRKGLPVSIASLPMMYYEKYGRTLQAEGYLTESQRHGKAGYSLTKLLARLKNSIRVIDRPHGQHSVVLVEDLHKYQEYAAEKSEPGGIVVGSRQIYLTFPADSTFTEQDVSNYFNKFGPVQDVRIPCQQKRMFGFVTFVYPETVRQILSKGNPHFVCGARVLVKPYREKSRLADRKFTERTQEQSMCCNPHFADEDSEHHAISRVCDNSRLLRKQLREEHEQVFELERRCLPEFHLVNAMPNRPYYSYSMDEFKLQEANPEQVDKQASERFNYFLDVLNNGSTSGDKIRHIKTNSSDQDSSQGLNLPESPFASSIRDGISTVT